MIPRLVGLLKKKKLLRGTYRSGEDVAHVARPYWQTSADAAGAVSLRVYYYRVCRA